MRTKKWPDITDPYGSPVGAIPSDDIELVTKGHEEPPAVSDEFIYVRRKVEVAKRTHRKMPFTVR